MAFLQQVFTVPTMVSGNTVTSSIELPGAYLYVFLQVPTMSAGYASAVTPLWIQASLDNVTFFRFSNPENNTNTVGTNDFQIVSACTQRQVFIPNFAYRYVRIETSAPGTGAAASPSPFKLLCVSNQ